MTFREEKAAENRRFVEAAVALMLERKIERAIETELHKLGFDWKEASLHARLYAHSLKELGRFGVTADQMLAAYAANNFDEDELIDEDEVYSDN